MTNLVYRKNESAPDGALSPVVTKMAAAADVFCRASTVCGVIMADSRVPTASRAAVRLALTLYTVSPPSAPWATAATTGV